MKICKFDNLSVVYFFLFLSGFLIFSHFLPIGISTCCGSMMPEFSAKSFFVCLPQQDYNVGDVVTVRIKNAAFLFYDAKGNILESNSWMHRIIRTGDYDGTAIYVTKGDNTHGEDPFVYKDEIVCKVIWHLNLE